MNRTPRLSMTLLLALLVASLLTAPASASRQWTNCTEAGEGPAPEFTATFQAAYAAAPVDLGEPVSGPYGCLNLWAGFWTQKFFGPEGETNLIYNPERDQVLRLYGEWLTRYIEKGGPAVLGVPTDNPTPRGGGVEMYFDGGSVGTAAMYRRDGGPIFIVQGAIQEKYYQVGGTTSPLGFPVSDEYPIDGPVNLGGGLSLTEGLARSDFEHGSLIYNCVMGGIEIIDFAACKVDALDSDGNLILI